MGDGLADITGKLSAAGSSIAQYADNFGSGANSVISPGSQASSYQAPTSTTLSSDLKTNLSGTSLVLIAAAIFGIYYLIKRG